MNPLNKSIIYKGFYNVLMKEYGETHAKRIWKYAGKCLRHLQEAYPEITGDSRMMILPAAALYKTLRKVDSDRAHILLKDYGAHAGDKIANMIHAITSIPGIPEFLWKNMPKLMRKMSSTEAGYTRKIVSETDELVGVDIHSCPLHDAAIKIGMPEVAQVVCAMDKAYMTGFRHIQYTRTTAVAEGDSCCDYRLSYDKSKG